MHAEPQTVRSYDGSLIAFRDAGDTGQPVVLLPGWACDHSVWARTVEPLLAHGLRVVSLDFAGFGLSKAARRVWAIENFARDVRAVLEALALEKAVLVGHSMGGAVALEAAYLCPAHVAGVVGCDSFTYAAFYDRIDERQVDALMAPLRTDYASSVRDLIGAYLLPDGDPAVARAVKDMMAGADPEAAVPVMEAFLRWDIGPSLARCPVPVGTINARHFLEPAAEARFRTAMSIRTLDGVGHFLMLEQPASLAAEIAALMGRAGVD